ncbi:hypothetical protein SAMN05443247_07876 [Bradyrhizobium erythrophlei]|jgi:hypothetical protein|nr:hypothetical protein SAMN05443247_07876 [Bradyrhizobium erythrophlei]
MLSVVSEAASEGMLFSAICAPSRFHTAKTQSGLMYWLLDLAKGALIIQNKCCRCPYTAVSSAGHFDVELREIGHEEIYIKRR